ncbi:MAG: hypothetical protein KA072_05995 [Thermoanaerobaculaceae bacterium]|nr:hypothetical protein [Thermoanaerobaculaceae bacterium]MDI9622059.1 hypothetical protein [Acidobacteriota bacterium]NLH12797.1 hypothetical protein [Holophagae bacterium]HPW54849.1 hypothetical protein [Thermoanaerobaculaceae bacterium]
MSVGLWLAAATLPALLVGAYLLWWVDRYAWEPAPRFLLTSALAAAGGMPLLLLTPAAWWRGLLLGAGATHTAWGPVVRDAGLRLAVLALVLTLFSRRSHLDSPLDGLVFGVAAGSGLAATSLLSASWGASGAELEGWLVVVSLMSAGGAVGLGLGWARLQPAGWRQVGPALVGLVAGGATLLVLPAFAAALAWAGVHCSGWVWTLVAGTAVLLPVATASTFAWFLLRLERRLLERSLEEEAGYGIVPAWLPARAARLRRRAEASWWPRRDERQMLNRLLCELAIKKQRVAALGPEAARVYGLEVGRLRRRLRSLLDPSWQAEPPVPEQE